MTQGNARDLRRRPHWGSWLVAGTLVLVACGDDADDADSAARDVAATDPAAEEEVLPAPVLDPATLSLDTPGAEEVEVERVGDDSSDTYVGAVDDDLFVAVVVTPNGDAAELVGYICDGSTTARWFHGAGVSEPSPSDPAELVVSVDGQGLSGTLLLDGQELAFEASAAQGDAGLFRADVDQPPEAEGALGDVRLASTAAVSARGYVGGWIILNAQEQRGAITLGTAPGVIAIS